MGNDDSTRSSEIDLSESTENMVLGEKRKKRRYLLKAAGLCVCLGIVLMKVGELGGSGSVMVIIWHCGIFLIAVGILCAIIALVIKCFYHSVIAGVSSVAVVLILASLFTCAVILHFKLSERADITRQETPLAHEAAKPMRELGDAIFGYTRVHNGFLPAAEHWCDLIMEYDRSLSKASFRHPMEPNAVCSFAFNKNLSGLKISSVPKNAVLLFEADGNWNLNGGRQLIEADENERKLVSLILMADGRLGEYIIDLGVAIEYFGGNSKGVIEHSVWEP